MAVKSDDLDKKKFVTLAKAYKLMWGDENKGPFDVRVIRFDDENFLHTMECKLYRWNKPPEPPGKTLLRIIYYYQKFES